MVEMGHLCPVPGEGCTLSRKQRACSSGTCPQIAVWCWSPQPPLTFPGLKRIATELPPVPTAISTSNNHFLSLLLPCYHLISLITTIAFIRFLITLILRVLVPVPGTRLHTCHRSPQASPACPHTQCGSAGLFLVGTR